MTDAIETLEQLADTDTDAALKAMHEAEQPSAPEPEPEPVKVEAPAPEPPKVEPKPESPRTVELAVLLEERRRRQDAEERAKRYEEMITRLQAPTEPPPPPKIPDYAEDPIEHLRAKTEQQEAEVRSLREQQRQEEAQRQAMAAKQQFVNWYQNQAGEFAKQQADFGDAYKHAVGRMQAILSNATNDPEQVAGAMEAWEAGVVRRAASEGRNPAEAIYEVAKTLGYAPPAPPAPETPAVPESLEVIERGVAATKSVTGGDAEPKMTLERLANLSGAAFDKAWEKMQRDGLLG